MANDKKISQFTQITALDPNDLFVIQRGASNFSASGTVLTNFISLTVQEEGGDIDTATNLMNFIGSGVTASAGASAGEVDITIPGDLIATQATDALVQNPTATEDGYAIVWNDTNQEYELSASGGNTIYTADDSLTGNRILTAGTNELRFLGDNDFFVLRADTRGETFVRFNADTGAAQHSMKIGSGGITGTIDPSALIEMNSTVAGFKPPTMTGAQVEAITSPATGLLAYATSAGGGDVTAAGYYQYNGANWVSVGGGGGGNTIYTGDDIITGNRNVGVAGFQLAFDTTAQTSTYKIFDSAGQVKHHFGNPSLTANDDFHINASIVARIDSKLGIGNSAAALPDGSLTATGEFQLGGTVPSNMALHWSGTNLGFGANANEAKFDFTGSLNMRPAQSLLNQHRRAVYFDWTGTGDDDYSGLNFGGINSEFNVTDEAQIKIRGTKGDQGTGANASQGRIYFEGWNSLTTNAFMEIRMNGDRTVDNEMKMQQFGSTHPSFPNTSRVVGEGELHLMAGGGIALPMIFKTGTSELERMRITSAGLIGINTDPAASTQLHVSGASGNAAFRADTNSVNGVLFATESSTQGRVGINTITPSYALHVVSQNVTDRIEIERTQTTTADRALIIARNGVLAQMQAINVNSTTVANAANGALFSSTETTRLASGDGNNLEFGILNATQDTFTRHAYFDSSGNFFMDATDQIIITAGGYVQFDDISTPADAAAGTTRIYTKSGSLYKKVGSVETLIG